MTINWTNIYLEEDLRALWGDVIDDLLELMDFEQLLEWINQPNEFLDNRTPEEVVRIDGIEYIEELIENHKLNEYN